MSRRLVSCAQPELLKKKTVDSTGKKKKNHLLPWLVRKLLHSTSAISDSGLYLIAPVFGGSWIAFNVKNYNIL
jgi:hypothetical protein